jgi:hypothetical protein
MNNFLNIRTPAEGIAQARIADFGLANHGISNLRLDYWRRLFFAARELRRKEELL